MNLRSCHMVASFLIDVVTFFCINYERRSHSYCTGHWPVAALGSGPHLKGVPQGEPQGDPPQGAAPQGKLRRCPPSFGKGQRAQGLAGQGGPNSSPCRSQTRGAKNLARAVGHKGSIGNGGTPLVRNAQQMPDRASLIGLRESVRPHLKGGRAQASAQPRKASCRPRAC